MSLILKGIDTPKGTDGLSITFHSQYGGMETHILDVTQAIQIPKGHGRLIDEKEVKKISHDVILGNGAKHRCIDTTRMYEVPTILESEVMPNE